MLKTIIFQCENFIFYRCQGGTEKFLSDTTSFRFLVKKRPGHARPLVEKFFFGTTSSRTEYSMTAIHKIHLCSNPSRHI